MKKQEIALIEHNLIPFALVAANFCIAHLFYLISIFHNIEYGEFSRVAFSMVFITAGIWFKNKLILIFSVAFYFITLVIALIG